MVAHSFYLLGKDPSVNANIHTVDIDMMEDIQVVKVHVSDSFSILDPKSVGFQTRDAHPLPDLDALLDVDQPVAVTIDGHGVRQVPGPTGLPVIGTYYEVFPDHIGNHQRMFDMYGPTIKHTDLGKTSYLTSDPAVATVIMQESPWWTKQITENHPLFSAKDNEAGLFLADTNTRSWRLAHKFLAPALTPKAVRKYTPMTQRAAEETFPVFDHFSDENEAFDVYSYMFKLTSQAVTKLTLNVDMHHFDSPDAPLNDLVKDLVNFFTLAKKVQERPGWYSHLPFGDPKRLRDAQVAFTKRCVEAVRAAQAKGGADLPISTAALEAESIADFTARAVDEDGNRMPDDVMAGAMPVVVAAGFATTSSLLSWMIHCLTIHPDVQNKLVQELIDHGTTATTQWNYDTANELHYLTNYINEVQRLYNPAHQPTRTALRDQIIPGGYEIPKGATLTAALHAIHCNSTVWDDPFTFNPDRWDAEKVRKRPSGAFMPFAMGPRSCIGFNFALQEAKTMFATLLYRYEFTKHGEDKISYDPANLLFVPQDLYVQIRRRTSWPRKSQ